MCSYAGDKKQGKAMCQRPNGVWAWEASATDYNPGFICGIAGQALQEKSEPNDSSESLMAASPLPMRVQYLQWQG